MDGIGKEGSGRSERREQARSNPLIEARMHLDQAEKLRQAGKLAEAERICRATLKRFPDYVAMLHTLGLVLADRKEYERALPPLVHATVLNPGDWKTLTVLAGVYLRLGGHLTAARTLEQARKIRPDDANILATLGEIYRDDREYEAAANAYREAMSLDPAFHDAMAGLGNCCTHLGRLEEAAKAFTTLLPHHPRSISLLHSISQLPQSLVDIDVLAQIEDATPASRENRSEFETTLAFTRAVALHNAGRHEEAWRNLVVGNKSLRTEHQEKFASDMVINREILDGVRNHQVVHDVTNAGSEDIPASLFVLGPSRSGKTTTEYLVSMHDTVKRGYENPIVENAVRYAFQNAGLPTRERIVELPPVLDDLFREHYTTELKERAGSATIFTNTHPGHIIGVLRIASIVPNAKFIFVKRDMDDIILRIYMKKYYQGNSYAYDIDNISEYVAWYYQMMDVLVEKLPHICQIIRYEDMIADPESALRVAGKLCGFDSSRLKVPVLGDDRGCGQPYREFIAFDLAH